MTRLSANPRGPGALSGRSFWKGVYVVIVALAVSYSISVQFKMLLCIPGNSLAPESASSTDTATVEASSPPLRSFAEILISSGSDKYHRHHYERYYEKWLEPYRRKPGLRMLEIGAQKGKSLQLWNDYFTNSSLILGLAYGYGATEGMAKAGNLSGVTVHNGDQSSKQTMEYLKSKGPYDIIIDDGSHVPSHMVFSMFSLWESITPGGMYIIEDLETNYWKKGSKIYGYKLNGGGINADASNSAVPKIQQLEHVLVRYQIGSGDKPSVMPGDDQIFSIEWGMNLVAITKITAEQAANNPPPNSIHYDPTEMDQWIEQAKASNPQM